MKYTVTVQRLEVLGHIWQPGVGLCGQHYDLRAYDLENMHPDPSDRAAVQSWIDRNCGDFRQVLDFRADFNLPDGRHIIHEWERGEASEVVWADCFSPAED